MHEFIGPKDFITARISSKEIRKMTLEEALNTRKWDWHFKTIHVVAETKPQNIYGARENELLRTIDFVVLSPDQLDAILDYAWKMFWDNQDKYYTVQVCFESWGTILDTAKALADAEAYQLIRNMEEERKILEEEEIYRNQ